MTDTEDTTSLVLAISRKLAKLTHTQRVHVLLTVAKVLGVELYEKAKA